MKRGVREKHKKREYKKCQLEHGGERDMRYSFAIEFVYEEVLV